MLAVFAIGIAVGAVLWWRSGGSTERNEVVHTASASVSASAVPTGHVEDMSVFSLRQIPSDALPASLADQAVKLGKPQPNGIGYWRGSESRRIAGVGSTVLYAWPVGEHGLCAGVVAAGGNDSDCKAAGPARRSFYVPISATIGDGRVVGGVVGRDVVSLAASAPGLQCASRAERSGFVCAGPAAGSGRVTIRLRLRDGSTRIVRSG